MLKYGIGRQVVVPVPVDFLNRLNGHSVQEGIQDLLDHVATDPERTVPVLRDAASDPRSVIEVRTDAGYQPLERTMPLKALLREQKTVEILVSRPHAGG